MSKPPTTPQVIPSFESFAAISSWTARAQPRRGGSSKKLHEILPPHLAILNIDPVQVAIEAKNFIHFFDHTYICRDRMMLEVL